ncbi:HigA family addiction module antitoxin [Celeribacter persicus]|uniref:Addiction module HigA family antidote n=1 Tax=Celeribacter persicus TaxID=1651082 RepID=A0A2T5H5W5_9RHOB|nr:HigA family addiction module antitoxin [Celeribacter persicus]PTQ66975.1 addiction module HigA family antidote [Celeribacter persicus]
MSKQQNGHPGPYIREKVIPKAVSVSEAAKTLNVGRPALSNLLNGHSALSPDMAARLERAFNANAVELLAMQSAFDYENSAASNELVSARTYVPPFLKFRANEIEQWASQHNSRARLAVFLRTLVHSTLGDAEFVDFPGNDDSERPGWDGEVRSDSGNPWVPVGTSGWEFGTNAKVTPKANKDYAKSVAAAPEEIRKNTTFVFVTPRRWSEKTNWCRDKQDEGLWKDVRAYDSSDLEQWLENSIAAQAWLDSELGRSTRGTKSLDTCWREWNADCDPSFTASIFDEVLSTQRGKIVDRLTKHPTKPIRIAADSQQEGLAFVHCLLQATDEKTAALRDRSVVFTEPGTISALATNAPTFLPVICRSDLEKELSQTGTRLGGIIISPRNMVQLDADATIDPLSWSAFDKALSDMGLGRDAIERLGHESGHSLTVLRRRLSQSSALKTPDWSEDQNLATTLFPLMLAGAWNASNPADQFILCHLAGKSEYAELEHAFSALLQLDEAPVWAVGSFRGVISKIDALYGVTRWVTADSLKRFEEATELVLSERDPSLDLPEKDRWAAGIYGKTREISGALRDGIAESLVLMAIHGANLSAARTGISLDAVAARLVKNLLHPLSDEKLESHNSDLPLYAEAAPETFLEIVEEDLAEASPKALGILRPAEAGLFGSNPRTGLLWALENLAWSPTYFARVIDILAKLSEVEIDDNWLNKPIHSLESIFRSWMPQTGADVEQRKAAMSRLAKSHPRVAWTLIVDQIALGSRTGDYNHKPRWRDYAFGYGEPVTYGESWNFSEHCVELAINWESHDRHTLNDLVTNILGIAPNQRAAIWAKVDEWATGASDEDKAWFRERIRVSFRRTQKRVKNKKDDAPDNGESEQIDAARLCFETLEPEDVVWKHAWLFKSPWVQESWDDIDDGADFEEREAWVEKKRIEALKEITSHAGIGGILRLAATGEAAYVIGFLCAQQTPDVSQQEVFLRAVLADGSIADSLMRREVVSGFLAASERDGRSLINSLTVNSDPSTEVQLLCLAPFSREIWEAVAERGDEVSREYWKVVIPRWQRQTEADLARALSELLDAGRPLTAFQFVHFDLERVGSDQLYRMLEEAPRSNEAATLAKKLDGYAIRKAIEILTARGTIGSEKLAQLEFGYLGAFRYDQGRAENIERQVNSDPSIFCEAIALAFKSDDAPKGQEVSPDDQRLAENAYHLLDLLKGIPGRNKEGEIEAELLEAWVSKAQKICADLSRSKIADYKIGELLSNAPSDADGTWPCEPVRTVLEHVMSKRMAEGMVIGKYNARGAHFRGEGGAQERELAERYETWAKASDYTHPKVAAMLRQMADRYRHEADWQDDEAKIRKRLRY